MLTCLHLTNATYFPLYVSQEEVTPATNTQNQPATMALDAMPVHLVLPGVAAPKEVRVTGTSTSRRGNASPPLGKKKSKNPCSKCPLSSTGCDHCLELKEHAERHALKCMLSYAENGEVRPGRKYMFADLADERGTP